MQNNHESEAIWDYTTKCSCLKTTKFFIARKKNSLKNQEVNYKHMHLLNTKYWAHYLLEISEI